MNILIAAVQVPFTRGGAEILVDGLQRELRARGHTVDILQLPFSAHPQSQLLSNCALWRAIDCTQFNGKTVDLVIATKFPSYYLRHPNKVVWLVHQHRQMYELHGGRFGDFTGEEESEALRQMLTDADVRALGEAQSIYTISPNVTARLQRYLGIPSEVLTPPLPLGERYYSGTAGDYILSVGRICSIKRVDLMIKSLPQVDGRLRLKVVGKSDEPGIDDYLQSEIRKHNLESRIDFLGRVSEEELLRLYAESFAVYYAPFDEDYGFVTLEGLASGKPIITATDSGGTLAFVKDGENGVVVAPTEAGIAGGINSLLLNPSLYEAMAARAKESYRINTWDDVASALVSRNEEGLTRKAL